MPILAQEPSVYPGGLLSEEECRPAEGQWWVYHVKARQEKAVARDLLAASVPFYLPLVKQTIHCGKRRFSSYVPLFPGYVFMHGTNDQRYRSIATKRLCQTLEVFDQDQLWSDLRRVQRLIDSGAPLTPESQLTSGRRVRIRRGPLMGLEGIIVRRAGKTHLVVQVDFLQQGASVEVEDHSLELSA